MPTREDRPEDLSAVCRDVFGPEPELSESVPEYQRLSVFARAPGASSVARDKVDCAWNGKITAIEDGGVEIRFSS